MPEVDDSSNILERSRLVMEALNCWMRYFFSFERVKEGRMMQRNRMDVTNQSVWSR